MLRYVVSEKSELFDAIQNLVLDRIKYETSINEILMNYIGGDYCFYIENHFGTFCFVGVEADNIDEKIWIYEKDTEVFVPNINNNTGKEILEKLEKLTCPSINKITELINFEKCNTSIDEFVISTPGIEHVNGKTLIVLTDRFKGKYVPISDMIEISNEEYENLKKNNK